MSRRGNAGSIFWGATLVAIGGLLLARNLGYPIPIWSGIARYWPTLIILWGLIKLVEYFRFTRTGRNGPLFSAGEVALLILVILAGSAITTAAHISPEIGDIFNIGDLDLWDITGNNYEYTERHETEIPAGSTIEILNRYGGVDVRPAESDRIVVEVRKTIRASTKEEADRMAEDFKFSIRSEGSRYRIASNRDGDIGVARRIGSERQRFKSTLAIQVPKRAALELDNRHGLVHVADLIGNQKIVNRYGQVTVRGITGAVELENRHGSVTVEDVTESAKIENSYAPITVANVEGDLKITGRNNAVDVERVQGSVHAESSYQDVSIREARGSVTIKNRNGDVRVSFSVPPEKDISISSQYSDIVLEMPSNSSFAIDAKTRYGSVESEFEILITGSGRDDARERSIAGRAGQGGPQIRIDARNGDIRLGKRG